MASVANNKGPEVPLSGTLQQIAVQGLDARLGLTNHPITDLEIVLTRASMAVDPTLPEDGTRSIFAQAIQDACQKHPDFTDYLEPMLIALLGVIPFVQRVTGAEFVEAIYCIAKYADFLTTSRYRSLVWGQYSSGRMQ